MKKADEIKQNHQTYCAIYTVISFGNLVKKYIEQVVVTFLGDRQAEIGLTMKTEEWKQMLERIELEGTDDGTKK